MATTRSTRTTKALNALTAAGISNEVASEVSGNALVAAAAMYRSNPRSSAGSQVTSERATIAQPWQTEVYRHVKICGEARYAAVLFSNMGARAELGVSEPQALRNKPMWVTSGPEVDAFAEIAPSVRERTKLIRNYMLHRTLAGESYLIARPRQATDFGYVPPPGEHKSWDEYIRERNDSRDLLSDEDEDEIEESNPNVENPIWEIVGVTELRRTGTGDDAVWSVRHDEDNWLDLPGDAPVIRMWNEDPEKRREAWSPFQAMLPTLREIEWLTMHIFTQVRSRLMSAGVWFLPENLTFSRPPASAGLSDEQIASLNEAEAFQISLAASSMSMLDPDEPSFPTIVMADADALAAVDQEKLIKFWSEIDDKAMTLRSDAIRRFALGMEMPPEQTLGSSGIAVSGTSGSAGSVNHWGEWAKEEQTISNHVEPALDDFVGTLTDVLRNAVIGTKLVIAYGTATLRSKQDKGKEAMEMADRGWLKPSIAVRENGFDPETDMPDADERKLWLLMKIVSSPYTPEQIAAAARVFGVEIPTIQVSGNPAPKQTAGKDLPPSLDDHPHQGPPEGDHEHHEAPYAAEQVLVLRALEKYGNRLLNDGKRGRDRDRDTPPVEAHLIASIERTVLWTEFDFSLAEQVGVSKDRCETMARFCASLYNEREPYTRAALVKTLGARA